MIRVLHVIGSMTSGGAEAFIMNYYRNIDRSKVQFDFAVRTNEKCFYDDEIESLGGKIYRVPAFNGLNPISYKRGWEEFFKEHTEHSIVHGHLGSAAAIYLKVAKKFGKITIAHSHNTNPPKINLREVAWRFWSYPTRNIADYLFACGKQAGIDRYGKKKGVIVINNAIDVEKFQYNIEARNKIRKEFGIADDKFVIGHVGRFNVQKNHSYLIDIFNKVHEVNKSAVLLLLGSGELEETIKEKVKEYNLNDSVIFAGVRKDLYNIYSAMDVFVFPSLFEGLPVVSIEAQTSGLHFISSNAVKKEANITGLIDFIDLDADIQTWVDKILEFSNGYDRKINLSVISNAGYDIKKQAKWLEEFYVGKVK